ncbi:hypothetical protein [Bacillus toyonensis]|uniref:hypothetical protein n=1 Tax=Bacillus toyonensis TaxID=155322 RepID=UPI000BF51CD3|nr:hypothetical protein [Bacillus toyonensis]PGF05333.1 hypothetical protein COM61_02675 [Bacillus toyonensis]
MSEVVYQYKKNDGEEVLDLIFIHNEAGHTFVCTSEENFFEFIKTVNAEWTGNEEEYKTVEGSDFKLKYYNIEQLITKQRYRTKDELLPNAVEVVGMVDGLVAVCYVGVLDLTTVVYYPKHVADTDKIFDLKYDDISIY